MGRRNAAVEPFRSRPANPGLRPADLISHESCAESLHESRLERDSGVLWSALIGVKGHPKLVGLWLSPLRSWPTTFGLFALDPERTSARAPPIGSRRGTGGPSPARSRSSNRKAPTMHTAHDTTQPKPVTR